MAWRSSGTNNDEMVDNLKRFGVIHSPEVEAGFRAVDRRFFVPRNRRDMAHSDQPLKEGHIHISAPHIYGSVIEALELTPNSATSFLNIGSGTGYLSCIVATILGPSSTNYGVEIHQEAVDHCRDSILMWKAESSSANSDANIEILHGNGLHIDSVQGESRMGLDRIYIGAAVEKSCLQKLASLLKPGGILVGPVDDELVKVIRVGNSSTPGVSPPRSFRGHPPALSGDFSQQVISGVRFANLLENPAVSVILPSRVWSPQVHSSYPQSFRQSCKEIMLCSGAPTVQPPRPQPPSEHINAASKLPRALWMEVLSYTRRDWFEQPQSEEVFLRRRLREEQAALQRAQEARMEAETRLQMVERERDVYRLLASRWQRHLQAATRDQRNTQGRNASLSNSAQEDELNDNDIFELIDDTAAAAVFGGNEPLMIRLGALSSFARRFRRDRRHEEEEDEDEDEDEDEELEEAEDHNHEHADMDAETESSEETDSMDETEVRDVDVSVTSSMASALVARQQARTVSITDADL